MITSAGLKPGAILQKSIIVNSCVYIEDFATAKNAMQQIRFLKSNHSDPVIMHVA